MDSVRRFVSNLTGSRVEVDETRPSESTGSLVESIADSTNTSISSRISNFIHDSLEQVLAERNNPGLEELQRRRQELDRLIAETSARQNVSNQSGVYQSNDQRTAPHVSNSIEIPPQLNFPPPRVSSSPVEIPVFSETSTTSKPNQLTTQAVIEHVPRSMTGDNPPVPISPHTQTVATSSTQTTVTSSTTTISTPAPTHHIPSTQSTVNNYDQIERMSTNTHDSFQPPSHPSPPKKNPYQPTDQDVERPLGRYSHHEIKQAKKRLKACKGAATREYNLACQLLPEINKVPTKQLENVLNYMEKKFKDLEIAWTAYIEQLSEKHQSREISAAEERFSDIDKVLRILEEEIRKRNQRQQSYGSTASNHTASERPSTYENPSGSISDKSASLHGILKKTGKQQNKNKLHIADEQNQGRAEAVNLVRDTFLQKGIPTQTSTPKQTPDNHHTLSFDAIVERVTERLSAQIVDLQKTRLSETPLPIQQVPTFPYQVYPPPVYPPERIFTSQGLPPPSNLYQPGTTLNANHQRSPYLQDAHQKDITSDQFRTAPVVPQPGSTANLQYRMNTENLQTSQNQPSYPKSAPPTQTAEMPLPERRKEGAEQNKHIDSPEYDQSRKEFYPSSCSDSSSESEDDRYSRMSDSRKHSKRKHRHNKSREKYQSRHNSCEERSRTDEGYVESLPQRKGDKDIPYSRSRDASYGERSNLYGRSERPRFQQYERMPQKLNIQPFEGSPEEYEIFKAKFEALCGDKNIRAKEKAVWLVDCLKGPPQTIARTILDNRFDGQSYRKVWKALDEHFGGTRRKKLLHTTKLKNFERIRNFSTTELLKLKLLCDEILIHYKREDPDVLEDSGSLLLSLAKDCLPDGKIKEYLVRLEDRDEPDDFISLARWIRTLLRASQHAEEESNKNKFTKHDRTYHVEDNTDSETEQDENPRGCTSKVSLTTQDIKKPFLQQSGAIPKVTTVESLSNKNIQPKTEDITQQACVCCSKQHPLWQCDVFRRKIVPDKNKFVRENKICFHCLGSGHLARDCDFYKDRKCGIDGCLGYHHRQLHPDRKTSFYCYEEEFPEEIDPEELINGSSFHTTNHQTHKSSNGTYCSIRTVPVFIKCGKRKKRIIVALDACCNNTSINPNLVEELGLKILQKNVSRKVDVLEPTIEMVSDFVQFNLSPLDESKSFPVTAWTVKDLVKQTPVVDWYEEAKKFDHLKNLNIPKKKPEDKIDLLLGTDHYYLMVSNKAYIGKPNEPCAEETVLGLAFAGTIKDSPLRPKDKEFVGISSLSIETGFISLSCQSQVNGSPIEELLSTKDNQKETSGNLLEQKFTPVASIGDKSILSTTKENQRERSSNLLEQKFTLDSEELKVPSENGSPTDHSGAKEFLQKTEKEKYSTYHDRKLHDQVKHLWEQEHMGLCENSPHFSNTIRERSQEDWTMSERKADDKRKVVYLKDEKKFQVSIPWRDDRPRFRTNKQSVLRRQQRCETNLEKNGTSLTECQTIFEGYEEKGYIRKVPLSQINDRDAFYIPWFPVIDRTRLTTQVRIVFDAAARDVYGMSLNSEIQPGPNRLQDLFKILLRMRKYQYVVTSDVSEMFLKIKLDPKDSKYHRFVFNGEDYEWLVIFFGNLSSPNASQKVLSVNCDINGDNYPEAVETIRNSCYMDDCCDSRETEEQAANLVKQLIKLLELAGMVIQKFYSNSELAITRCEPKLLSKQITFEDKDVIYESGKVLGMSYSADSSDCLQYAGKFKSLTEWSNRKSSTKVEVWTKRLILRAAASVYDPLGLISPFTVRAKVIMQEIWKTKVDWQDPVEESIVKKFLDWLQGVIELSQLKVPRWTGFSSESTSLQIHVFCDASEDGYCVAVYSRIKNYGEIVTTLLTAKSRVSPLKSESISRMELIACVLGCRVFAAVKNTYPTTPENTWFWTDSQVALHWISTPAKSFKAFVAHRVGEIQIHSDPKQWNHIPTTQNPADIGTRHITVPELIKSDLWWKGPAFLTKEEADWPKTKITCSERDKEFKTNVFITLSCTRNVEITSDIIERLHPRNFSVSETSDGYIKCLKKWAYLLRAVRLFKKGWKAGTKHLLCKEIEEAKEFLIKEAQREFYQEEISAMQTSSKDLCQTKSARGSKILTFNPVLDSKGIVRSNSRISRFEFYPYSKRFPIILPRQADFTKLLVSHIHVFHEHPIGNEALKAEITNTYAILGIGSLCRTIKFNCQKCKRSNGKTATQLMAPLPSIRLEEEIKPFSNVGIDYAGPFEVKMGRRIARKKVSILVFTCLQIRAVHLEVTGGQDTSHVLNAISRFADIRGVPKTILSDNQTSFRKADKDLREWFESIDFDEIVSQTGFDFKKGRPGIRWVFNPPVSPHFGGIFETIVKSTKRALYATIQHADLDEEEFRTVVSNVTGMLNERPISKVGNHEDMVALTPNSFLFSNLGGSIFPSDYKEHASLKEQYNLVQEIATHFWKRFHKEMTQKLIPRQKWSEEKQNLEEGDVVVEMDPNLPKGAWRMLRVTRVYPGTDGLVRRVEVTNSAGRTYERGISRLIPIVRN